MVTPRTRAARPEWWNGVHDRALADLTPDWQDFADLKPRHSKVALDDLVVAGEAEVRQEDLFSRHGIACGCRFWFRRFTGHPMYEDEFQRPRDAGCAGGSGDAVMAGTATQ